MEKRYSKSTRFIIDSARLRSFVFTEAGHWLFIEKCQESVYNIEKEKIRKDGLMPYIAPSLLAADFSALGQELQRIPGADMLHIDIMDGRFVPNITVGPQVVAALRGKTQLPFDVHLMLERPLPYIQAFRKAGADIIAFHIESGDDPQKVLEAIEASGAKAAVAISPATSPEALAPFAGRLSQITVMTVEPGFGGQKLIPSALEKLPRLRELFPHALLEVDGGVNLETAPLCRQKGADILVAGTAVFRAPDPAQAIGLLRNA